MPCMNCIRGPFPLHRFLCASPHSLVPTCSPQQYLRPSCPTAASMRQLCSSLSPGPRRRVVQIWLEKKTCLGRQKGDISSKLCYIPLLGVTSLSGGSGGSLPPPAQPQTPSLSPKQLTGVGFGGRNCFMRTAVTPEMWLCWAPLTFQAHKQNQG